LKNHAARIVLGLLVVALFVANAARWIDLRAVEALESIAYDVRLKLTMPGTVDTRIVVVDIDEKSLGEIGRWPWPRNRTAELVDTLFDHYRITVLGFDVTFPERDESSGLGVLEALAKTELKDVPGFQSTLAAIAPRLQFDTVFADRLKGRPVILGYYFSNLREGEKGLAQGVIPTPVLPAGSFKGRNIEFTRFPGYGGNLPELQNAAAGAGHFTPATDGDGVHRRVPLLAEYDGAYYEPLSLAIVRLLLQSPKVVPGYPSDMVLNRGYPGLEWIDAGPVRIPVDERANVLVPYRGPERSFPYVSAADVLAKRAPPDVLKDRIVLVGTTAPGLQDLRSTPVAPLYAGVEIHANLISGMLDGTIKQKPPYVIGAEVMLLLAAGLFLALGLPLLNPLKATVGTLAVLAAVTGANVLVWSKGNLVLPLASGVLMILLLYGLNMSWGYFVESRAKRKITGRFGQYVPPEIADEMSRNPDRFSMEGESAELSVLFSDVRGFTTISEGLDPKALSQLMNAYLTPMTQVIYAHRGTIDKYMGDAIMAFWGAPIADPDHAKHAVQAGLEMQQKLAALEAEFKARGWPPLKIGVGVNSGRMSVGNMGSEVRVAYTVMGDAVNLASRLESITKRYGVGMIVGEATRQAVPDMVFRELDRVRVKGKDEPVAIHEPIGPKASVGKDVLDRIKLFQQVLKAYRAQDWDAAELQLMNLKRMDAGSGALYDVYMERIAHFRVSPPPSGWDGTHDFDSK
jgi:adenylate cyclase